MNLLSVVYVNSFIAKHVLCAVRCDDCSTCLTSPVMSTNALIYFKEYKDDKQSLTYPSERLVMTVIASVNVLDGMMADVAHTHTFSSKNYRCHQEHRLFWMDSFFWLCTSPPRDSGWYCMECY